MDGYHRTTEQLSELDAGEWKSVGDVASIDAEGYLAIRDRKKDMIISGGVNIYPAEIEAVLYAHPQVLDAAVIGIPDEEWGESVYAIVQPKAGETISTRGAPGLRRVACRSVQAAARVRGARRVAAHRFGEAPEAGAPRRVLARPGSGCLTRHDRSMSRTLSEAESTALLARPTACRACRARGSRCGRGGGGRAGAGAAGRRQAQRAGDHPQVGARPRPPAASTARTSWHARSRSCWPRLGPTTATCRC